MSPEAIKEYLLDRRALSASLGALEVYSLNSSFIEESKIREDWEGYMLTAGDRILKIYILPNQNVHFYYSTYQELDNGSFESEILNSHEPKWIGKILKNKMTDEKDGLTLISNLNETYTESWIAL